MSVRYEREWDNIVARHTDIEEGEKKTFHTVALWDYDTPTCLRYVENQVLMLETESISRDKVFELNTRTTRSYLRPVDKIKLKTLFDSGNKGFINLKCKTSPLGNCFIEFNYLSREGRGAFTMELSPDIVTCVPTKGIRGNDPTQDDSRIKIYQLDNKGNLYASFADEANIYREPFQTGVESLYPVNTGDPVTRGQQRVRLIKDGKVYFLDSEGNIIQDDGSRDIEERIIRVGVDGASGLYLTENGNLYKGNKLIETDIEEFTVFGVNRRIRAVLLRKHNDRKIYVNDIAVSKFQGWREYEDRTSENLPELEGLTFLPRMRNVKSARKLAQPNLDPGL